MTNASADLHDDIEQALGGLRHLHEHNPGVLPDRRDKSFITALSDDIPLARKLLAGDELDESDRAQLEYYDLEKLRKKGAVLLGKAFVKAARNRHNSGYPHELDSLRDLLRAHHLTLKQLGITHARWRVVREARIKAYNAQGRLQRFIRGRA